MCVMTSVMLCSITLPHQFNHLLGYVIRYSALEENRERYKNELTRAVA